MKTKLSTLWAVVLFNMLFRDLHEFARTGFIEELLAMTSGGAEISEALLFAAALVLQIPISMVFLCQVLRENVNRWVNLVAAGVMIAVTVGSNLAPDLDDVFFASVECVALLAVMRYAWTWSTARHPVRTAVPAAA